MQTIRKINNELAITGQISLEQLADIAHSGFQSILNLRSPAEVGFLFDEQQQAETLGLHYVNLPFQTDVVYDEAAIEVLQELSQLPKPVLVHCDSAIRSATIALIHIATRQGATLDQAFQQANRLGLLNVFTPM